MKHLPSIIFITDTTRVDVIAIAKSLPKNSGIILRDYDLSFEERFALGKELKKIAQKRKLKLIIAGDIKLAEKLKADGIHFPEHLHYKIRHLRTVKKNWIILAAAHSRKAAVISLKSGADAILLSPMYETASHPRQKPLGPFRAKAIMKNLASKTYGLGGIDSKKAKTLQSLGFRGFAAISGLNLCGYDATVGPEWVKNK